MIDSVGNEIQDGGAVIPKACQKCKKEFKSEIKSTPIKQDIPFYKCKDCKFENASGDATLEHKLTTDHKLDKIIKSRLIGHERKILGNIAHIIKTDNNIIILCGDCDALI
jgi:hypothetical protein